MTLHRPHGTLVDAADPVRLMPQDAGWTYAALRVLHLAPGERRRLDTGEFEAFALPLAGAVTVEVAGERYPLTGRESVFTRVTDFAYLPRDAQVTLSTAGGCELALPMARCTRRLAPRYGPAEGVPVEVRGAGNATRQVTNFGVPGAWDHADKLNACELITPGGNWSSYPPHKHDDTCDIANEEIYYFRVQGPGGFGLHRTYDDRVDETVTVRDGDVFLIPHGYHGPCVAAPGYPLYYLNVLAGPAPERSMAFHDDPTHTWIRDTWPAQLPDPRCPLTTPTGPRP